MHNLSIEIKNHLQDAKEELLSTFISNLMESITSEGFNDIDFLEALADYIDNKYGHETTLILENLITHIKNTPADFPQITSKN